MEQELAEGMIRFGIISRAEAKGRALQHVFKSCDPSGDGLIDYDEFGKSLGEKGDLNPMYLGKHNKGQVYELGDHNGGESKVYRDQQLRAVGVLTK